MSTFAILLLDGDFSYLNVLADFMFVEPQEEVANFLGLVLPPGISVICFSASWSICLGWYLNCLS